MARFAGRPLDQVWFIFLTAHFFITLAIDLQALYPPSLLKGTPFPAILEWYISLSRDPILTGVIGGTREWAWLKTFFWHEALFQMPCFAIGAFGLWKNDKRVYPLLVAYGAATATTLLPVLNAVLTDNTVPALTSMEIGMLLSSYVPFLLLPLGMSVDFGLRLVKIVGDKERKNK